ncbi:MAG: DUF624 domain-containing protein [Turicibacter sp.]
MFSVASYLVVGNIYFLLVNIPAVFIAYLYLMDTRVSTLEVFIALIPIGPGMVALLSAMNKLINKKESTITKDFFKAYKNNFKISLFVWTIQLSVLVILYVDILHKVSPLRYLFILLFIIMSSMTFYTLPLIVSFHIKLKDALLLSFMLILKKFVITFTIWGVLILGALFFFFTASVSILFIFSLIALLIMYYQKNVIEELKIKYLNT